MTQFSHGKLQVCSSRREMLPVDGGYANDGRLTRDPNAILESRRPLPIGYWKGSGLALMLDMVAALLSGGQATHQISEPETETRVSQVFIAFDATRLAGGAVAEQVANEIIADVLSTDPAQATDRVTYPGERTLCVRANNLTQGIPVDPAIWQAVQDM